LEKLEVQVVRASHRAVWHFRKEDTGWTILKTDKGTCKGVIEFEPEDGNYLKLEGSWKKSSYNGEMEFCFEAASLIIPEDPRAKLNYACSICNGIGPAKEQIIWATYRDEWEQHPDLEDLTGLSEATRSEWGLTIKRLEAEKLRTQAMAFLLGKGCSLNMANLAYKLWEGDAIGKVSADCFVLTELPNYGFGDVDQGIRQNFDIGDTDPRRIRAGIRYALKRLGAKGSTAHAIEDLHKMYCEILGAQAGPLFSENLRVLVEEERATTLPDPMGLGQCVSDAKDYQDEKKIWEHFDGA